MLTRRVEVCLSKVFSLCVLLRTPHVQINIHNQHNMIIIFILHQLIMSVITSHFGLIDARNIILIVTRVDLCFRLCPSIFCLFLFCLLRFKQTNTDNEYYRPFSRRPHDQTTTTKTTRPHITNNRLPRTTHRPQTIQTTDHRLYKQQTTDQVCCLWSVVSRFYLFLLLLRLAIVDYSGL